MSCPPSDLVTHSQGSLNCQTPFTVGWENNSPCSTISLVFQFMYTLSSIGACFIMSLLPTLWPWWLTKHKTIILRVETFIAALPNGGNSHYSLITSRSLAFSLIMSLEKKSSALLSVNTFNSDSCNFTPYFKTGFFCINERSNFLYPMIIQV